MNNKFLFILPTVFFILFSCKNKTEYFNAPIKIFDYFAQTDSLVGTKIELSDIYTGNMLVYDSLMIFQSAKYTDYMLKVFNLNTGKLSGTFCSKGQGPDDYLQMGVADQFEVKDGDICLWTRDVSREEMKYLNLTKSIKNHKTEIDCVITGRWRGKFNRSFSFSFVLNDNKVAFRTQPELTSIADRKSVDYIPGAWYFYDTAVSSEEEKIVIFKHPVINLKMPIVFDSYLHSIDRAKPDKSKIVMAMNMLSQVNIMDVTTKEITGIRMNGTPDFVDLTTTDNYKFFYDDVCVDDTYIYGLYLNADISPQNLSFAASEIHIYDWEGNPVRKIIIDIMTDYIAFDPVKRKLYAKSTDANEQVVSFDMNYLYH